MESTTFAKVPVKELRAHPNQYTGAVFDERFIFSRIWWSHDRAREGLPSLDLPTHFTARIVAAPLYIARIEFPPEADSTFENMRDGTEVRLRVRFVGIHPESHSPVFVYEAVLPATAPSSDLDYLRR